MQSVPGIGSHIAQILSSITQVLCRIAQLLRLISQLLRLVAQVLQRIGARAVGTALAAGRVAIAVLVRELNLQVAVVVIVGIRNNPVGIDDGR